MEERWWLRAGVEEEEEEEEEEGVEGRWLGGVVEYAGGWRR